MLKNHSSYGDTNSQLVALSLRLATMCLCNGLVYTSVLGSDTRRPALKFSVSLPGVPASANTILYTHVVTDHNDAYVKAVMDEIEGRTTSRISPPAHRTALLKTPIYYWRRLSVTEGDMVVLTEPLARQPKVTHYWVGYSRKNEELTRIPDGSSNPGWEKIAKFEVVDLHTSGSVVMVVPKELSDDLGEDLTMGEEHLRAKLIEIEERRLGQERKANDDAGMASTLMSAAAFVESKPQLVSSGAVPLMLPSKAPIMPMKTEYKFDFLPSSYLQKPPKLEPLTTQYISESQRDELVRLMEFGETEQAALAIIAIEHLTPPKENFEADNYPGIRFKELIEVAGSTLGIPVVMNGDQTVASRNQLRLTYMRIIDMYCILLAETPLPENRKEVLKFLSDVVTSDMYWFEYSSFLPLPQDSKVPKDLVLFTIELLGISYPLMKEMFGSNPEEGYKTTTEITEPRSIVRFTLQYLSRISQVCRVIDRMRNSEDIKDYVPADEETVLTVEEQTTLVNYLGYRIV